MAGRWALWIDRGGTFTDCIGRAPDGRLHTAKLLSSDTAPVAGIRRLLEAAGAFGADGAWPPCDVKLGTTVATNALLERRGVESALVAPVGFGDLLHIGTQERPELFELAISRPPPLCAHRVEVAGRLAPDGRELEPLDEATTRAALAAARARGARAAAVALLHAYADPRHEERVGRWAREAGFEHVALSSELACELGLQARAETAAVDAYLTPLLRGHVDTLSRALPAARLRFMQSSGTLTDAARFRGPSALLSGPAGGAVAAGRVAAAAGHARAIGFDMGGTSTDVSLVREGEVEQAFETRVGGVRVRTPMLRVHTVAAGGGSLCRFDGFRLTVGPESAGAEPGPLCYGRAAPEAGELALTDVNAFLGRVQPDRFPFALTLAPVRRALERLARTLADAGLPRSPEEIAAGFVEVANAGMAQAIEQVSVARGVDPRDFALVGFGGAGGQHVCAVARQLGMRHVLLHPLAGLLSAYGIGISELGWDGQRDAGRLLLDDRASAGARVALPAPVAEALATLEVEARAALADEGAAPEAVRCERWLDLRYAGSDASLAIREPEAGSWLAAFAREHEQRFGYTRSERPVEIATARLRARARPPGAAAAPPAASPWERGAVAPPPPLRRARVWFPGAGRVEAPVYAREALEPGCELAGPALVLEDTGTAVLDPGFRLRVDGGGVLHLRDEGAAGRPARDELEPPDPVRLEVFGNRFMSIAEQMGAVLRNTAFSTNIKERLDYSCAVFDGGGGLVANAPHIPVHLGAMGETVRAVRARFPDLEAGDVVASNDPFEGGSHLPDVTVVTPVVLDGDAAPSFFVASRGHHADIGGISPGSMPAHSQRLDEEGVVLSAFRLVRRGQLDEAELRRRLTGARHPARRPEDNVADIEAAVAANRAGADLLRAFCREQGARRVAVTMRQLQAAAAAVVAREIGRLPDGEHRFEDAMDDGTPVCASLRVAGQRMVIDFEGTGPASPGNLNAPPAVVAAAVIYVLRCLVAERIPLNGGCLEPVEIRRPPGSLLDPPPGSAVVGGNVETSQRVVDVLLAALGLAAASQGTMNNIAFGHERFGYYETLGGGAGAGPGFDGASAVHTHMTNTRITDPEVIEARYPVRLREFSLRGGSGGAGRRRGGDGLIRRYEFLVPVTVSLLSERRVRAPFGLAGGAPGARGEAWRVSVAGARSALPGRCQLELAAGEQLELRTPGGGGYGEPEG